MAKLTITDFFLLLDAPLRNHAWSWGAITPRSQDVVFRVWNDEMRMFHGKRHYRLTLHEKWKVLDPRVKKGYEERMLHIDHALQKGRSFFVYCRADHLDAVPRKIVGYANHVVGLCESIIQDDAQDFWGEETRIMAISEYQGIFPQNSVP